MTLINQLKRQAYEGATVLDVPENHASSVAEHIRILMCWRRPPPTKEECEQQLRDGKVRYCNVPMRVIPKRD